MKNVIEKLIQFNNEIKLSDRFNYDIELSNPFFDQCEIDELVNSKNTLEKNFKLKWIIKEKYKTVTDSSKIDFWVINTWGGIRGFKKTEKNIEKIKEFKKQLEKKKLTLDSFSTISSLSKISSFIDPDNFVIYDSRVIYTLNYLILKCENQKELKEKYFPMPTGRNKIIADFDMNTIINILHIDKYVEKSELFISQQQAYFIYCDFVKNNAEKICGVNAKPYELEILLFALADKEIFEDIKCNIKLTTANKGLAQ